MTSIRGIMLTYDPQLGLAQLAHKRYAALWPTSPIRFRVPINGDSGGSARAYFEQQTNCELVRCGPRINETMLALLDGLDDDEWIFWCIDDRYPTWMEPKRADAIVADLGRLPPEVEQVKFLHWHEQLDDRVLTLGGERFRVQCGADRYWGFWHHHLAKPRILKNVLLHPSLPADANINQIQDVLLHRVSECFHGIALVPETALLRLAEPLVDGVLTTNGVRDLELFGCECPSYAAVDHLVVNFDSPHGETS